MDFDPSSATSLLDLQPDIPLGGDHDDQIDLQNPCLSNLHRSICSFPSESSGKNCSPGGGDVDEPVSAAAGPHGARGRGGHWHPLLLPRIIPRRINVPSSATSLLSSSTTTTTAAATNSKLRRNGRDGRGRPTRSSRPRPTAAEPERRSGSAD